MQSNPSSDFIRVSALEMELEFYRILIRFGFDEAPAKMCAEIFTGNSLDGVYSHGVTRFPKFIKHLKDGHIKPNLTAICKNSIGGLEQWDGQSGPGPVNAMLCTGRAMELASVHGIGCVALANTNHWLRGGTYGWKAARADFVYLGWSNTIANMPAWGATNPKLGNNPLIIAVPYQGEAIILDMAMSQYSYGALEMAALKNEKLPVPGGYDEQGQLTVDPAAIRRSQRPLPIGYWKGAGLSLLLDIVATILSGGLSASEITSQHGEYNLSQVFMAIDLSRLHNIKSISAAVGQIILDYQQSVPEQEGRMVRYPGEKIVSVRKENAERGIPVLKNVWEEVTAL